MKSKHIFYDFSVLRNQTFNFILQPRYTGWWMWKIKRLKKREDKGK